jgi:uncharacterized iron-regulated membrane protein
MRLVLVKLHRWLGLFIALFLLLAGLTGALIAWDHELDAGLNPQFYHVSAQGHMQDALSLAQQFEVAHPDMLISYLPLAIPSAHTLDIRVENRAGSKSNFNQVFINPYTGETIATRMWGKFSLAKENLIPFIYKLHYSLHLPNTGGWEIGVLFMGIVGMVWTVDSFIALWIAFPNLAAWRKSFVFRWQQGGHRLVFDLHRSGGVWVWLLLLMMAITSVAMNLNQQVMRPIVAVFSDLQPGFVEMAAHPSKNQGIINRAQIVATAQIEAQRRHSREPAGGIFYSPALGLYGVGFFKAGQEHGDGGLGNLWLYYNAYTGKLAGAQTPGLGSAGDIFLQAQFPLHSGRILGITGRIIITLLGLIIAMLSLTGILIWAKKRKARRLAE